MKPATVDDADNNVDTVVVSPEDDSDPDHVHPLEGEVFTVIVSCDGGQKTASFVATCTKDPNDNTHDWSGDGFTTSAELLEKVNNLCPGK